MKRNTPLITLLVGAALGVVLLVSNMLATPSGKPGAYSAAAASAASVPATAAAPSSPAPAVTESSPASATPTESPAAPTESSAAPEESSAPASAPSPAPTRTTPTKATYTARVGGGGGSVAVAVHGSKAIAYVCNGSSVEGWMRGKVENGILTSPYVRHQRRRS